MMTKQSELTKSAREARNEYYREYRARNKDKIARYNRDYWIRRAARLAAEGKAANDK